MIKNFKWIFVASIAMVSCTQDEIDYSNPEPEVIVSAGDADFSKYVALGNSLTAGFSDGALFIAGQNNAYPKLLADQFATVGGGAFNMPLMNDNNGGLLLGGTPIQGVRLVFNGSSPVPLPGATPTTDITNVLAGPFNNLGVPGAKSFHLLANGYGNIAGVASGQANPYFVRFASSPSTSIIADAVAQNPTFFSLWIGNNDVLSYATSGGVGVNQLGNPNPATYGANDITDPTVFASVYTALTDALTANGAKGVVANLPYVNSVPFFTTVPTNPIPATSIPSASAAQLNQLFGAVNQITTALGQPNRFVNLTSDDGNPATVEANNPLLIVDESLPNLSAQITAALTPTLGATTAAFVGGLYGQARHARSTTGDRDYVLLTTRTVIGTNQTGVPAPFNVSGISYPLQDNRILTAAEVVEVKTATDAFNVSIKNIADTKGLAFVDVNALMNQLSTSGVRFGTFHMTASFVQGGAFGLDGIHLTARANAYVANQFMTAISAKYGSVFKMYKPESFPLSYPASL
ncbi:MULTISPECIES: G-D-S-L family lipolytic protein [Flavobacterium]|uniref:G-D-S-L family lipolytic protein n=1 Tax=Flavobacterium sedimenticola TaxID=3043286 RepID=A0ABT6XMF9_9FLAO|nr:G-D-S-L family lipolytic protein [Flavobacterium sedimenticola]MDI9256283.1 G-D-S-L family lipolytic protein [Flavobacterium sedimenticola]